MPTSPMHPTPLLEALRSPLLLGAGFDHAFFTRRGGSSPLPWGPSNFAVSVGDEAGSVARNFEGAAAELGVLPERLYVLSQTHGTEGHWVEGGLQPRRTRDEVARLEGDALYALPSAEALACGVRTADCAPILLADPRSGAVAAVHSGWRGTAANIASVAVAELRKAGACPGDLLASIGPHIEACCFEVGDDVAAELARCSSLGPGSLRRSSAGRPKVDLRSIVRAQLLDEGLLPSQVEDVRGCTACDAERFHSFRRDREASGRLLSAIVARRR